MYKITRNKAAIMLNISTRSIDRYIRNWKLRSKKNGKIVYINEDDINNFLWIWNKKQEIITWTIWKNKIANVIKDDINISIIFDKLKDEINIKDEKIKVLSVQIWKMEEIIKNSISMIEFKKSQFLLEESKSNLISKLDIIKKDLDNKNFELQEEKKLNYILISLTIIIFIILIIIWFIKI